MTVPQDTPWFVGDDERLLQARQLPSPNADARPQAGDIGLLVIHGISLPPGEFGGPWIDALFSNALDSAAHPCFAQIAGLRVSAHCCVFRDGAITQYVPFGRRAWHAGVSRWRGRERCNDFSIGIELEGADHIPYTDAQYTALTSLAKALFDRYPGLSVDTVVGHCDIAPGRKTDPGAAFDWPRLRRSLESA